MFSLVSRDNLIVYRRRTGVKAILRSSVPGNFGPDFLLFSSSDLGVFFERMMGFEM